MTTLAEPLIQPARSYRPDKGWVQAFDGLCATRNRTLTFTTLSLFCYNKILYIEERYVCGGRQARQLDQIVPPIFISTLGWIVVVRNVKISSEQATSTQRYCCTVM